MKINLLDNIHATLPVELIQSILVGDNGFRMERIVSRGHYTSSGFWYDQNENEWIMLVSGSAIIEYEENKKLIEMYPGDTIIIPAHCRHRVVWTDPLQCSIWLVIFYN
ncbi:cupin domain-containing protein [Salmonella enterica subsp. salamae]|uniref:Cupin domain-containing protein n=3 Tax=Salmonella enterica TaxID=28901 RepID=A0A402XGZ7_SALER|nr:phosphoribosylaminoimidazole carboxylase [Salmonella enterica]EDU6198784.1 cupin domain-containing protein [Salmonella enterica subsp. salamae]EAY9563518.1 cupin domain-containing protein [Salmonella enterica]EBQ2946999.1 cupin domain-containing protein [Salmonella enterica]EEI3459070.1 cupin domain-containing protein [Salmonella enterica subsp. salamae]